MFSGTEHLLLSHDCEVHPQCGVQSTSLLEHTPVYSFHLSGHLASSQLWALLNKLFSQYKTHQEGGKKHKHGESFNRYKGLELKLPFSTCFSVLVCLGLFWFWFIYIFLFLPSWLADTVCHNGPVLKAGSKEF